MIKRREQILTLHNSIPKWFVCLFVFRTLGKLEGEQSKNKPVANNWEVYAGVNEIGRSKSLIAAHLLVTLVHCLPVLRHSF